MGRALIILVLLMSTLFVAVAVRVQRDMAKLPETLLEEQLQKEAEDVSDYVLRYAVLYAKNNIFERNAWNSTWSDLIKQYGEDFSLTLIFDSSCEQGFGGDNGNPELTWGFPTFKVESPQLGSEVTINQIKFSHLGDDYKEMNFLAQSLVSATLQGETLPDYRAEIAFGYDLLFGPNCFFFEFDQPTGNNQPVQDTSGNEPPNDGYCYGNKGHTTPEDVYGWKGCYFEGPDSQKPTAFFSPDKQTMWVDSEFTLVLFLKCDKSVKTRDKSVLIWMPSTEPQNSLDYPSIGIWYEDSQMHFGVGLAEGAGLFEVAMDWDWRIDDADVDNSGNEDEPWDFVGMTFSQVDGKSMINVYTKRFKMDHDEVILQDVQGQDFQSGTNSPWNPIVTTQHGVSHGARVIHVPEDDNYYNCEYDWFFQGKMDNTGLYNYALTADEIDDFFWNNVMQTSQVTYIRD